MIYKYEFEICQVIYPKPKRVNKCIRAAYATIGNKAYVKYISYNRDNYTIIVYIVSDMEENINIIRAKLYPFSRNNIIMIDDIKISELSAYDEIQFLNSINKNVQNYYPIECINKITLFAPNQIFGEPEDIFHYCNVKDISIEI